MAERITHVFSCPDVFSRLAAQSGSSLVSFWNGSAGAAMRGVQDKLRDVISVKDFGAVGDGSTDDSTAIQNAVNAAGSVAGGAAVFFPYGRYRITQQINVLRSCRLYCDQHRATIILGTQHQNGFVIGDGTLAGHNLALSTSIDGFIFEVAAGLGAFTAGAMVLANYVSFFIVQNCHFYGFDGATKKMWNGVSVTNGVEWRICNNIFQGLRNNAVRMVGTAAQGIISGRIDFNLMHSIDSDCIYFGDYTAAITVNSPILYSYSGWGIKIDCTPAAGFGINYMIWQPDIEASTTSAALGAVYFKTAVSGQINGGWFGGNAGLRVDSTAGNVLMIGVQNQAAAAGPAVQIDGPACMILGCDIAGDAATTVNGITVGANAIQASVVGGAIRQFTGTGIAFTGAPANCQLSGVRFLSNGTNVSGLPTDINATAAPVTSTSPTPTSAGGGFTSASSSLNFTKGDNRVKMDALITITTNGPGSGDIRVALPFTPAATTAVSGIVIETGVAVTGYVDNTAGGRLVIVRYDGTYPGADNRNIRVFGEFRV